MIMRIEQTRCGQNRDSPSISESSTVAKPFRQVFSDEVQAPSNIQCFQHFLLLEHGKVEQTRNQVGQGAGRFDCLDGGRNFCGKLMQ